MRTLDHLILVAPSLEAGVDHVEATLGVRPAPGGQHEGRGTQNALLAMGERCYLEILAPDPSQPEPAERRFLGVSALTPIRLATWVAVSSNLEQMRDRARALGVDLGEPKPGGRRRPDGSMLTWRLLGADAARLEGVIPFFIDWGTSPHPSASAPRGGPLRSLRAQHPDPARVREVLAEFELELEIEVEPAASPGLIAMIECARGVVSLR